MVFILKLYKLCHSSDQWLFTLKLLPKVPIWIAVFILKIQLTMLLPGLLFLFQNCNRVYIAGMDHNFYFRIITNFATVLDCCSYFRIITNYTAGMNCCSYF